MSAWTSLRDTISGRSATSSSSEDIHSSTTNDTTASSSSSNSRPHNDATPNSSGGESSAPKFEAFDPTALERGVKAIRELNQSPHAERALELSGQQEQSKQLALKEQIELRRLQFAEQSKQAQMEMAEQRKHNEQARNEDDRRTALYKTKLQSKLEQEQLAQKRAYDQEKLKKHAQNEKEIQKQRLAMLQQQASIDRETARVRADADADGQIKRDRATEDVSLRRLREEKGEERKSRLESIGLHYENVRGIGRAIAYASSDPIQMAKGVGLVTALSLGFFGARAGTSVVGRYVQARLGRPQLVRESSRSNWLSPLALMRDIRASTARIFNATTRNPIEDVVLPRYVKSRLQWIADSTVATKAQGTPYRHLLMHGEPGTGKTLFARALAANSGMDYAIVSGGDLSQLGNAAVTELHQLFDWAEHSPRGAVLFFDEADSFLRSGRDLTSSAGMSEQGRHVVSAFLQRTGSETNRFMMVLATNLPVASFDAAVRDRIDEFVELPMPEQGEREEMLRRFFARYLETENTSILSRLRGEDAIKRMHSFTPQQFVELAQRTAGMSGRQMAKFVISLRAAVYGGISKHVTPSVAEQLLDWKEWEATQNGVPSNTDADNATVVAA